MTADAATRYKIWYAAGVLAVWKDGNLQFSNQPNAAVDTGDISISSTLGLSGSAAVAGNIGLPIGTGATPLISGAVTITAAAAEVGTATALAPTVVAPVDGTSLTRYLPGRNINMPRAQATDQPVSFLPLIGQPAQQVSSRCEHNIITRAG